MQRVRDDHIKLAQQRWTQAEKPTWGLVLRLMLARQIGPAGYPLPCRALLWPANVAVNQARVVFRRALLVKFCDSKDSRYHSAVYEEELEVLGHKSRKTARRKIAQFATAKGFRN